MRNVTNIKMYYPIFLQSKKKILDKDCLKLLYDKGHLKKTFAQFEEKT